MDGERVCFFFFGLLILLLIFFVRIQLLKRMQPQVDVMLKVVLVALSLRAIVGRDWEETSVMAVPLILERSGAPLFVSVLVGSEDPRASLAFVLAAYSPAGADVTVSIPSRLVSLGESYGGRANLTLFLANDRSSYDLVLYRSTEEPPALKKKALFFPPSPEAALVAVTRSKAIGFRNRNEARGFRVVAANGGFWKIVWSSRGDEAWNFCELSGGRGKGSAVKTTVSDFGAVHEVIFACRDDNEAIEYSCGSSERTLSEPRVFRCPSLRKGAKIVVFGNLGVGQRDASRSFEEIGGASARATADLVAEEDDVDLVLHLGGLSLNNAWDDYLDMIEGFASKFPYAPLFGAPEIIMGKKTDSSPAMDLFPWFPSSPWRSLDVGLLHVLVMSTDLDFSTGSEQWRFIQADFAAVDRSKTPWLLVAGYRPMYVASSDPMDLAVSRNLRKHIEPLLLRYDVDLCFWGKHRSAQRHCSAAANRCLTDKNAPIHFVFGSAGGSAFDTIDTSTTLRQVSFVNGFGTIDVRNDTHLVVSSVNNGLTQGPVLDTTTVVKHRQ